MRHIVNRLFSKFVLGVLMILLQFGWIVYGVYFATEVSTGFNIFFHALSIIVALYVVKREIKPYFKLSWIFFILCLPILGIPCYFLYGRSGLTKKQCRRMEEVLSESAMYRMEDEAVREAIQKSSKRAGMQSEYITNYAGYPLFPERDTRYFPSGEEMFAQLLEDIRTAKDYIFVEYFIMQPGKMLDSIVELLEQKAKEGVHVRLIYDDVGCIQTIPRGYYKDLQSKGIHVACFNPFRPLLSVIMNNRDHRKILVVDGKIAYTGGVNLADEYINEVQRFGYWKDAAIRITGEGAWSFAVMFLEQWNWIVKGSENYDRFCPVPKKKAGKYLPEGGFVQPFSDSPFDKEDVGENVYLNMINNAEKYVYIFTPYLIVSWEMTRAMINAAKCGVDVRIVTPGIPDKKMVYLLTRSNFETLIRGGVKIYQYTPGFIHSKCFVCDDRYAVVGTINLDFRSFYLHFECGVFLYQAKAIMQVKEDALRTFEESHQVSVHDRGQAGFFHELLLSILHLFAPLL